ncbi:MAG TPA: EAL domain-containing protein, partial [Chloroflexota bacterium]|nr:EAL domain-containing protein [Chloroflexota bacterium]
TQADIPNLWAYAQHFTLGDHMFASAVGSTFPNHLYSVAAQSGGVVTNFQPKVDLATGHAAQVEALVRWQHPERGFIPPDHFILLAEQTGLIRPLTQWVLDAALRTCHEWQRADLDVRISIDDFGTGYSSLSHLRRLPVDEIKIDKSFVVDMAAREDDALIVRSIVDLAHHRDLAVVAEGVETPQIRDLLAGLDCDMAQGYGLSRPLPAAALTRWLQESHPAAAT